MGGGEEQAALPALHLPDIPEYSPQERMTMEKEVTGLYLSGHPMDAYREAARAVGAVTIGSILSDFSREDGPARYRDGEQVTVAGVIATYKTRTTRNNTLMAYVDLEDDTASMELLCFSRVLNESGGYIRENSAILVTGKISVRDEKEPQLMVDAIRPLGDLDGKVQTDGQRLYLRLPCREDPRLRKVKLACPSSRGEPGGALFRGLQKAGGHPVPDPSRPGGGPEGTAGRGECGGKIVCAITKMLCRGTAFLFQVGGVQTGDMI